MTDAALMVIKAVRADIVRMRQIEQACCLRNYVNAQIVINKRLLVEFLEGRGRINFMAQALALNNDHVCSLLVRRDDVVIGYAIAKRSDQEGRIGHIYIDSDAAGQGAGSKLLSVLLEWIGGVRVVLEVVSFSDRAINFYKKFGFGEDGDIDKAWTVVLSNGVVLPEIRMVRPARSIAVREQ